MESEETKTTALDKQGTYEETAFVKIPKMKIVQEVNDNDGTPKIYLVECKTSRKKKE